MKISKLLIILICLIALSATANATGSANVSILYGWNGTNFIPVNVTSGGAIMTEINMTQSTGVNPKLNNTYDLGTTALIWANLYVRSIRGSSGPLSLYAGGNELVTLLANGNVGINTTAPSTALQVTGNVSVSGLINAGAYSGNGENLTNLPFINVSLNYGWNTTNFVPLLTTGGGTLQLSLDQASAVNTSNLLSGANGTDLTLSSNLTVRGNISVGGNVTPITNGSGFVGTSAFRFSTGYFVNGIVTGSTSTTYADGNITFGGGPKIIDDGGRLKLQAGGAVNGSGNTSSIYFLDSGGTVRGRFETNFSSGGPANGYGSFYTGSSNTAATDLAEYYVTGDRSLEAGDVVSMSDTKIISGSEEIATKGVLRKSSGTYDGKLIGVISTQPGFVLGSIDGSANTDKRMLALAGRVPVKVSNENGPIEIGDYLTSSSTPGIAMKATKAGPVIGRALERFDCTSQDCRGTIESFVELREYDPDIYLKDTNDFKLNYGNIVSLAGESISRVGIFNEMLAAKLTAWHISASEISTGKILSPDGSTVITIDNGRVGINNSNPKQTLAVVGTVNFRNIEKSKGGAASFLCMDNGRVFKSETACGDIKNVK